MKFTKLVATLAIIAFAINANAYSDGTLRRGDVKVAQNDATTTTSNKEVNININTTAQAPATATQQPVTVVEAAPMAESKAEGLRKARQDAEVQTEQKIVEKLEDSRLQEERARADRLFGNKLDPQPAPVAQPAPAPVVVAPAPAPAPVAPVQEKPTQVTIQKVEIVQPAAVAPVAESKTDAKEEKDEESKSKWYVSGLAGNLSYQANNVHSNYGLGVAVGTILNERFAIELSYFFSNHTIDDLSDGAVYHKLDQSDVALSGKYYLLGGKLKPYLGGSVTYIDRKYQDRMYPQYQNYYGYSQYNGNNSESTQSIDMGVLAGVDFAINDQWIIGAGVDYNFNVMNLNNMNNTQYYYGYNNPYAPGSIQQLEKINYYAIKVNGKFTF